MHPAAALRAACFVSTFLLSSAATAQWNAEPEVIVSGLDQPIGLTVDGNDRLWVSEMGARPQPGGPPFSFNGRLSYIDLDSETPVVNLFLDGLANALNGEEELAGAHHLLSSGRRLWLVSGGPPSFIVPTMGSVHEMKIKKRTLRSAPHEATDGTIRQSIDVAGFALEQGFPDSNAYSVAIGPRRDLFIADSGANAIFRYNRRTQEMSVFATLPEIENTPGPYPLFSDAVPTKIIAADDFEFEQDDDSHHDSKNKEPAFYVGQLTGYPFTQGSSRIWALYRNGSMKPVVEGMTTVVDIAIDPEEDALVVVSIGEWRNDFGFFQPGTGSIVSIDEDGDVSTVIDQLFAPTAVAFDEDGNLYTSSVATGNILKLER